MNKAMLESIWNSHEKHAAVWPHKHIILMSMKLIELHMSPAFGVLLSSVFLLTGLHYFNDLQV